MVLKNEAKVGLLVAAAIVVMIAMYWFLRGFGFGETTFPVYAVFTDARKLDKGADVRMAGVKVGLVQNVRLTSDSRARVDMVLWDDTCIPADSVARITTGAFIGDYYVDVIPGSQRDCLKHNQKMRSSEPMNYEKLVGNVGSLIDELKISVAGINSILADKNTIASVKETVRQLELTTTAATILVKSAQGVVNQASPNINCALSNMKTATDNAVKITEELQSLIKDDARPNAREVMAQAKEAMVNLNATIIEAKGIMAGFGGSVGKVDGTLAKIEDAAMQADEMMKNLSEASKDVKDITSDKEIKKNIKDTMRNAAEATASANALLCNLNRKLASLTGSGPSRRVAIPNNGFTVDSLWNTTQGDYRFDANYAFGGSGNTFYRVGAWNIGETTRANLQMGQVLSDTTALRYGIYASRVGLGFDQKISNNFILSADGFRPNDPQYDVRAVLNLSNGFGLYGGFTNVFGDTDVFTGIHYSK